MRRSGGVLQGIKSTRTPGEWPDEVAGYGPRRGGQPLARCVRCPEDAHPAQATTFVVYGETALCKAHARELAG